MGIKGVCQYFLNWRYIVLYLVVYPVSNGAVRFKLENPDSGRKGLNQHGILHMRFALHITINGSHDRNQMSSSIVALHYRYLILVLYRMYSRE